MKKLYLMGIPIGVLMAVLALGLFSTAIVSAKGKQEKVEICHVPPGNPANANIIEISGNAVAAHVAHGDNAPPDLSPCGDEPEPPTPDPECAAASCTTFIQCNAGGDCDPTGV